MKYDLAIAHRVCPVLAKTAVGFKDKLEMVKATTASLMRALKGIDVRVFVILDGCDHLYERCFDEILGAEIEEGKYRRLSTPAIGNQATYAKQLELLAECAEEAQYLYFSEDDYLYRGEAFRAMMEFLSMKDVDFVTPLDHPDRYSHLVPESRKVEVRVSRYCHWREVGTTCCTFMTKSDVFLSAKGSLACYGRGSGDGGMWLGLTKDRIFGVRNTLGAALRYVAGRRTTEEGLEFMTLAAWRFHKWQLPLGRRFHLWGPMPTLAVHLCEPSLPPFAKDIMNVNGVAGL